MQVIGIISSLDMQIKFELEMTEMEKQLQQETEREREGEGQAWKKQPWSFWVILSQVKPQ